MEFIAFSGGQVHVVPAENQDDLGEGHDVDFADAGQLSDVQVGAEVSLTGVVWSAGVPEREDTPRHVVIAIDVEKKAAPSPQGVDTKEDAEEESKSPVEADADAEVKVPGHDMHGRLVRVTLWRKGRDLITPKDEGKEAQLVFLKAGSYDGNVDAATTQKTYVTFGAAVGWWIGANPVQFTHVESKHKQDVDTSQVFLFDWV